jgi:hypothetical protein
MSNKQWYVVYTKAKVGMMYRYTMEYDLIPFDGFETEQDWREWHSKATAYFHERTGIQEKVLAIEPAEFISAYPYKEVKE